MRKLHLFCIAIIYAVVSSADSPVRKCKPRGEKHDNNGTTNDASGDNAATHESGKCEDGNQTILDPSNFDSYVGVGTGAWFIFFYTDWCKFCKALMPEWNKVASNLAENGPYSVGIAKFDCTQDDPKAFCHKLGVTSYPNIRLFNDGIFIEKYNGSRKETPLLEYIAQKSVESKLKSNESAPQKRQLPPLLGVSSLNNAASVSSKFPVPQPPPPPPPPQPEKSRISTSEFAFVTPQSTISSTSENIQNSNNQQQQFLNPQQQQVNEKENQQKEDKIQHELECSFTNPKTLSCRISKLFSILIPVYASIKVSKTPLFSSSRMPAMVSIGSTAPLVVDVVASTIMAACTLRARFLCFELVAYAFVGAYAAAATVAASIGFGGVGTAARAKALAVGGVLVLFSIAWAGLPVWALSYVPYCAAAVIVVNRWAATARPARRQVLPHVKRKSVGSKSSGGGVGLNITSTGGSLVLDLATAAIVARIVTCWLEVHSEFGIAFYFIVLGVLHVFGSLLFPDSGIRRNVD